MSFDNKQEPPVYGAEDLEKGIPVEEKSTDYELETEVDSDEETPFVHGKKHGGRAHSFGKGRGKHFKHFAQGPYAAYYSQFGAPPHPHHHHAFGARGHHHQHGFGFPGAPPPPPPPPPHGVFAAHSNDPYFHPFAGKRKKRFTLKRIVFLAILALSAFVFFGLGRAYESKELRMFSKGHHGPHHDFRMEEAGHHGFKPKHRKPHHKDDDDDVEAERFPGKHHQEGKDQKEGQAHSQEEFHAQGEEAKGKGHKGAKGKGHKGKGAKGKHHGGKQDEESKDEVKAEQEGEVKHHKGEHKGEAKHHKGEHKGEAKYHKDEQKDETKHQEGAKGKDHKNKGEDNKEEEVAEVPVVAVAEEKKEQDQK